MTAYVHPSVKARVSLFEQRVQSVHLTPDRVHDGLTVYWTSVEQYVEQGVVGKMPQLRDTLQRDGLQLLVDSRVAGMKRRVPGDRQDLDPVYDPLRARSAIMRLYQLKGYTSELVNCDERIFVRKQAGLFVRQELKYRSRLTDFFDAAEF